MLKIPDGYYVFFTGDSAIVYNNKRYTLTAFAKMLRTQGFNNNDIRDWLNSDKHNVKVLDPLWDQIKLLPLVEDKEDTIAPEEDGEIERYGAYTRLNPSGHREQVIKRKGKTPEETLNELADTLIQLLESSPETSMPSGKCWYCDKPKDNIYGLCMNCGRFGKLDNQQSQTGNTGQVPWEGPDPTIGAQRIFTPHSPGMSSEQDYIRRQNNLKHGFDEPIEPFQLRECVQADTDALTECAEEYIWNRVFQLLPEELHDWPGINDFVDQMIGDGKGPDEIVDAVNKAYWDE